MGDNVVNPLRHRRKVSASGVEFDVQKNRMNGQIITFVRLARRFKHYCPVENQLDILDRAVYLSFKDPGDPLCVYRNEKGEVNYLTGTDITAYYREVTLAIRPNITDIELSLQLTLYECMPVSFSTRPTRTVLTSNFASDGSVIVSRYTFEIPLGLEPSTTAL